MYLKNIGVLFLFALTLFAYADTCHSRTIDDLLSDSSVTADDSKRIKGIYDNILKFEIKEDKILLIVENALNKDMGPKRLLRLLVLISKSAVEDLPTEALINKVLEGFAKSAPTDVIINEAESKVLFLKNAKTMLNYLTLKGFEATKPEMVINMLSIYSTQGWDPIDLKRAIETGGLSKKEFHELSMFLKQK